MFAFSPTVQPILAGTPETVFSPQGDGMRFRELPASDFVPDSRPAKDSYAVVRLNLIYLHMNRQQRGTARKGCFRVDR